MVITQDILFNLKVSGLENISNISNAAKKASSGGAAKIAKKDMDAAGGISGMMGLNLEAITKPFGSMISLLGSISGAVMGILGIAGGFALLVSSSKSLQKIIEKIGKMIMLVLRPIGDMLAILFMPLMMLIKPLAVFMNALFRPFLTESRKAFSVGMKFFSMGMKEKGTEAMFAGIQLMAMPIIKLLVIAIGQGMKTTIDLFFLPFEFLLNIIKGIGGYLSATGLPVLSQLGDALVSIGDTGLSSITYLKDMAKGLIDDGVKLVVDYIDNEWAPAVIDQVSGLKDLSDSMTKNRAVMPIEDFNKLAIKLDALDIELAIAVSEEMNKMIEKTGVWKNTTNSAIDEIINKTKELQAAANAINIPKPTTPNRWETPTAPEIVYNGSPIITSRGSVGPGWVADTDFSRTVGSLQNVTNINLEFGNVSTQSTKDFVYEVDRMIAEQLRKYR